MLAFLAVSFLWMCALPIQQGPFSLGYRFVHCVFVVWMHRRFFADGESSERTLRWICTFAVSCDLWMLHKNLLARWNSGQDTILCWYAAGSVRFVCACWLVNELES